MNVLLTGAGGFVGSALADGLSRNFDCKIVALGRDPFPTYHDGGIFRISHDLSRPVLLNQKIDYIVHCAAVQNFRQMSVRDFLAENLEMTRNIAEYGKKEGVRGIIFTSSIDLHGEVRSDIVDERTDRVNPSLYGISKFLCEELLREYQDAVPVIALRLCGVVGSGEASCWPARMLAKAQLGERIDITNGHREFNSIVHTDDLVKFIHALICNGFSGFSAFPIASTQTLSIRDVVDEIISATGSRSEIHDNGVAPHFFNISNDYAMNRYGYAPETVYMNLKKYLTGQVPVSTECTNGAHS